MRNFLLNAVDFLLDFAMVTIGILALGLISFCIYHFVWFMIRGSWSVIHKKTTMSPKTSLIQNGNQKARKQKPLKRDGLDTMKIWLKSIFYTDK